MSKLVRRGTKLPKSEVHNATKRGNLKELAKLLKSKKGYTVEDRSPKSNRTPLHIAARKGSERNSLQPLTFVYQVTSLSSRSYCANIESI